MGFGDHSVSQRPIHDGMREISLLLFPYLFLSLSLFVVSHLYIGINIHSN